MQRLQRGTSFSHIINAVAVAVAALAAVVPGCGAPAGIGRGDRLFGEYRYEEAAAAYESAAKGAPLEAHRGACRARMYAGKLAEA